MVMHYYELHDEEALRAMKKLSLGDAGNQQPTARANALQPWRDAGRF